MEIADAEPVPPSFDRLVLDQTQRKAPIREHRYACWRTVLASVVGLYLTSDPRDGRQSSARPTANQQESRWSSKRSPR
jgi:hypothetical protein